MGTGHFKGALLSTLVIASLITPLLLLSPSPVHAALTPHAPIYINGNGGFTPANGVTSGSGTKNDPYIIENWDINAENAPGIEIMNTTAHFIIRNCYVHDGGSNYTGIYFYNVTKGAVDNTIMENNQAGITLWENSDNNLISNNTCENNYYHGINLGNYSSNNTISNNTANNNLGYDGITLWENCNNNTLFSNTCLNNNSNGIVLGGSDNNTLTNNTCKNNGIGILLEYSENNVISYNTCSNNGWYGISLDNSSDNNTLINNTCENNEWYGIDLYYSDNNTSTNNTCEHNSWGINLYSSENNLVSNNICKNNYYGIYLNISSNNNTVDNNTCKNNNLYGFYIGESDNNLISRNTCKSNEWYGIRLLGSSNGNRIYHNNFINNENQASDDGSNYWDNGYPSGGNLWSDYTGVDENHGENQDIPGSDRIGDTPYYIPGDNNRDRYPLIWGTGSATFELENLYKVSLEKDLQLNTGKKLVVKFYGYGNVTLHAESVIENIPPNVIKDNENVPHPLGAPVPPPKYLDNGTVQIAKLVLTTDDTGEVISTLASFTVHQSDLKDRIIEILGEWFPNPDKHDAFRAEVKDILSQWFPAPP